jgi:hypothetical protein
MMPQNQTFHYGELAVMKSQAGLNSYWINDGFSKIQRLEKLNKDVYNKYKNWS